MFFIKVRIVPYKKKPSQPIKINLPTPHVNFASDEFLELLAPKTKLSLNQLKTYKLLYQANGMGDENAIALKDGDTFFTLKLLNGAPFLLM